MSGYEPTAPQNRHTQSDWEYIPSAHMQDYTQAPNNGRQKSVGQTDNKSGTNVQRTTVPGQRTANNTAHEDAHTGKKKKRIQLYHLAWLARDHIPKDPAQKHYSTDANDSRTDADILRYTYTQSQYGPTHYSHDEIQTGPEKLNDTKDELLFGAKVALTDAVGRAVDNFSFAKRYALATTEANRDKAITRRITGDACPSSSLEVERHTDKPITVEQLVTASVWNELKYLPAGQRYISAVMLKQVWEHATPTDTLGVYRLPQSELMDTMTDIFAAYFDFKETLADSLLGKLTSLPGVNVTHETRSAIALDKYKLMDIAEDYSVPEQVNLSAINVITLAGICRKIQTECSSRADGDWITFTESAFTEYTENEVTATVTEPASLIRQHETDIVGVEHHPREPSGPIQIHVDTQVALAETATWALDSLPEIATAVFTRDPTRSVDDQSATDTDTDTTTTAQDRKPTETTAVTIDTYK